MAGEAAERRVGYGAVGRVAESGREAAGGLEDHAGVAVVCEFNDCTEGLGEFAGEAADGGGGFAADVLCFIACGGAAQEREQFGGGESSGRDGSGAADGGVGAGEAGSDAAGIFGSAEPSQGCGGIGGRGRGWHAPWIADDQRRAKAGGVGGRDSASQAWRMSRTSERRWRREWVARSRISRRLGSGACW